MLLAEDQPRKRQCGDRRRIVARLQQTRERFLAQAFELGCRKRRTQDDVGHQGQRVGEFGHRCGQPHGGIVEGARCPKLRSEEFDRVGQFERGLAARAFVQHVGRHAGHAVLPGRIRRAAGAHDQVDLHEWHFALLDDPHRQPVGEGLLLHRRKLQGWWRRWLRRRRAVGLLRVGGDGEGEHGDEQDRRGPARPS